MHTLKSQKHIEQMLVFFKRLGALYALSFTNKEILENKIIGVDTIKKKVLIVEGNENKPRYDFWFIDLYDVKTCRLKRVYNAIKADDPHKNKLHNYLNVVALEFDFKNSNTPFAIGFYKNITNSLHNVLHLETKARYWEKILSKILLPKQPLLAAIN